MTMPFEMGSDATEESERLLWASASATALLLGFTFAPDCEDHMKEFIRDGVRNMHRDRSAKLISKTLKARANLTIFVGHMVLVALDKGLSELHEPTFFSAKASLCPLWPFC